MKILIRLPNWLGDMVMSIGFINALTQEYPDAAISVIAKKGIHTLLQFFPHTEHQFIFSKEEHPGFTGAWRFGKMIRKIASYDLFFCLPDSFSSAIMGYSAGAKQRIGYKKEFRSVLFTRSYKKISAVHRVEEYVYLLRKFTNKEINPGKIVLTTPAVAKEDCIIININSEASSRRLPVKKAIDLITAVRRNFKSDLVLIGSKKDIVHVTAVINNLPATHNIINLTGRTSLPELVRKLSAARLVLTTDSGPAHIANALGIHTITLFGAGNEQNTAPFNQSNLSIIRLGKLPCEPCVKNVCVLYGTPKCLEMLDEQIIVNTMVRNG